MTGISRRDWLKIAGAGLATSALSTVLPRTSFGLASAAEPELGKALGPLVTIPGGRFLMGTTPEAAEKLASQYGYHVSWLSGEVPERVVDLPAYAFGKYPVTNREFGVFCAATGYPPPPHWGGNTPPAILFHHPVTHVNQLDALNYAKWACMRLPTEAEWEKAARGVSGRTFPWGDQFDPSACQWNPDPSSSPTGTAPVTAHPTGVSPYGVFDLVGNVAEWCADGPSASSAFIKGGAWITEEILNLRPAARNMSGGLGNRSHFYGFRCAKDWV